MTTTAITTLLTSLKTDLLNSLQANGKAISQQTVQQITVTPAENGGQLEIPVYLQLLETGRAPTGPNPVAGNPTMIQRIRQWCSDKGIPDKAAWAIKKSIDKKGFKGTPGIITTALGDDNINFRLDQAMDAMADAACAELT